MKKYIISLILVTSTLTFHITSHATSSGVNGITDLAPLTKSGNTERTVENKINDNSITKIKEEKQKEIGKYINLKFYGIENMTKADIILNVEYMLKCLQSELNKRIKNFEIENVFKDAQIIGYDGKNVTVKFEVNIEKGIENEIVELIKEIANNKKITNVKNNIANIIENNKGNIDVNQIKQDYKNEIEKKKNSIKNFSLNQSFGNSFLTNFFNSNLPFENPILSSLNDLDNFDIFNGFNLPHSLLESKEQKIAREEFQKAKENIMRRTQNEKNLETIEIDETKINSDSAKRLLEKLTSLSDGGEFRKIEQSHFETTRSRN